MQVLMEHASLLRIADNKHMSFLFLIKIWRDKHWRRWRTTAADTTLSMRDYKRYSITMDEYCDILKDIWDAGFDTNTVLDERFVDHVCAYDGEFSNLVRDAEQSGEPRSTNPLGRETISAVVFAAQHVPGATVVLALLRVNTRRDDFTDEDLLEAFVRSAIYNNLMVYEGCRNAFLGRRVERGGNAEEEGGQVRGGSDRDSDGAFERPVSQELRRMAEVFPSSEGQGRSEFHEAFCRAMRTEGLESRTFAGGRTLCELAERAENVELLIVLKGDEDINNLRGQNDLYRLIYDL